MHSQKFLAVPALFLAAALPLSACSASGSQGPAADTSSSPVSAAGDLFTARDLDPSYDADAAVSIALCGTSAVCDSGAVELSGSTVTITSEGTYRLSGALEGMVIVDVPSADKVQLVLEDASIFSAASAAIYVRQADKVFLTLADGSQNTLENGGGYTDIDENCIDAVIFSKEDLTLNGSGALTISGGQAGHGVVSKDDLVITGGTYAITAAQPRPFRQGQCADYGRRVHHHRRKGRNPCGKRG